MKLKSRNHIGCAELVSDIVDKADGVFLWVVLVVRDRLEGLRNEDGVGDLQRRLKQIPSDLEQYFAHTMGTLHKFYFEQADQLFQTALKAKEHIPSLMTYSFAHGEELDWATLASVEVISEPEFRFLTDTHLLNEASIAAAKDFLKFIRYPATVSFSVVG